MTGRAYGITSVDDQGVQDPRPKLRRCVLGLALLCGALSVPALFAASATAAFSPHVFTTSFGAAGSTPANPYPLGGPLDVAVDQATRDIYVADTGNHRIEKFDPSGNLILMFGREVNRTQLAAGAPAAQQNICDPSVDECQSGAASAAPGAFQSATFLAVDNSAGPSSGDLYVGDLSDRLVTKFESDGHLVTGWNTGGQLSQGGIAGIAVSAIGDLFVLSGGIHRYGQAGNPISESGVPRGTSEIGLAVDGFENFYKVDGAPNVTKFHEGEDLADTLDVGPATGLTVDPTSNDLYVDESGSLIRHFALNCGEYCSPLDEFGSGHLSSARGLSVDGTSDDVYVANTGENDVAVFNGILPYTKTGPASAVGRTTATITGHIAEGGRGAITECQFEYGTDISYAGGAVACEPGGPYGNEANVNGELNGLQPETTYHYRLVAANSAGTAVGVDRTVTPHFVLGVSTGQASNLTNEAAELNGSYVGDGNATSYYFEYGTSTSYGETTPERANGGASGPQSVNPEPIAGLQPFTTYHYRFIAKNSFGTTSGQDRTFTTFTEPSIEGFSAQDVTATTANLRASIDPQGGDTHYYFEYGPTTTYGFTAPSPPADIGSSQQTQTVDVGLSGLQAGATYHFRLTAENQYGTVVTEDQTFNFFPPDCPNAHIRQQTGSSYLPDCRAYEIVSPGYAGAANLYPEGPNSPLAVDPARLSYGGVVGSIPGAGDMPDNVGDLYVATRTEQGWTTKYVGIPANKANEVNGPPGEPNVAEVSILNSPAGVRADPTLSRFLDWDNGSEGGFVPEAPGSYTPHVWAFDGASLGEWPTVPGHPAGPILNQSPDFSHYIFVSEGVVYDNNTVANTISAIAKNSSDADVPIAGVPGISNDGSHIVMSTAACGWAAPSSCGTGEMFVRIDDAITRDIAPGHQVRFVGMTSDASKVYFTADEQLTEDDKDQSKDLYMWSEAGEATGTPLVLVSVGNNGSGNSDECSASWTEKCGVGLFESKAFHNLFDKGGAGGNGLSDNAVAANSGDIYFYSPELLDGQKGVKDAENLYLYRNGHVQFVTSLTPGSFCEMKEGRVNQESCSLGPLVRIQVSPDGAHMSFLTASQVTSYDNRGHTEMYIYRPLTGEVKCVSCVLSGAPPASNTWASSDGTFMTNDGRTFFSTSEPLVLQDTDNLRDVYEFVDGRAQLISSGTSTKDATAGVVIGINEPLFTAGLDSVSADGVNVYFSTYDTLVGQDTNGPFLKFYDARSGGGFPYDPPPPSCTAADECTGAGSLPPTVHQIASGADLGSGGNATHHAKKHHRKARKRHHRGSRAGKLTGNAHG